MSNQQGVKTLMKQLVIEIPLEGNDFEETDFETFCKEANFRGNEKDGFQVPSIGLLVGRSVSEEESHIVRQFEIGAEYYNVHIQYIPDSTSESSAIVSAHLLGSELELLIDSIVTQHMVGKTRFLAALLSNYEVKKKEVHAEASS